MSVRSIDSMSDDLPFHIRREQIMINSVSAVTISDEISNEVATTILTQQKELNRDPNELLKIVLAVQDTLRQLSAQAHWKRSERIDRLSCAGN